MKPEEIKAIQLALRSIFLQDLSHYATRFQMFNHIMAELSVICRAGTELQHKHFREWILFGDAINREREEDCK